MAEPLAERCRGRHLYALYSDERELGAVAAGFVRAGLAAAEKVGYVTGSDAAAVAGFLNRHGVAWEAAAASGQLVVISLRDVVPSADGSRTAGLAAQVQLFVENALGEGYAALRIASEVRALVPSHEGLEQMRAREALATDLTATLPMTGVCLYDRREFGEDYLEAAGREHDGVLEGGSLYADDLVEISRERDRTLRVAGEIDRSNAAALREVLVDASATTVDGVIVDVSELSFIDVAGLRALAEVAMTHAEAPVCLERARASLVRMLTLSGWSDLPNLIVVPMEGSP